MSADFAWKYAQESQNAAFLQSQTACALIEMAAMQAENTQRQACGMSIAYGEAAFSGLIDKYGIGHNSALDTLRANT